MSSTATTRHGLTPAPTGFNVVQNFINTDGGGQPDLLADVATAEQWFTAELADWSATAGVAAPTVSFGERDRQRLVELRAQLRQTLHHRGSPSDAPSGWLVGSGVSAGLRQRCDGTVVASPQGAGWKLVASLLLIESLAAQTSSLWPRLKVCRNEACGSAFYDRSRNNSGVWHDVLVCGNAINLRTSRARRRAAAAAPPDPGE
ncbi:CGNR zinc finger domain-containing protein [Micromonospora sp. WMMD1155]|uniref:CGNR zinc finger domain-containing protein n=1 Tax=Micromonospora sp. WMMD1155 TaxID=3016094 RepID=UPI00249BBA0C|nr:CGNR zinc finger domain-containing protein [Micromonospora sp. WMMD1155]WFE48801.1 CGNR zinc finger domain-containing protein [Micromonospora sp. WMMD1155]WFE54953.1 CGNR zinc finger domain-containing protein [Micromonospora sp. WMMD1155]